MIVAANSGLPNEHWWPLAYVREHTTLAKIAAGFGISEAAHTYTCAVIDLLADRAPGMLLREADPDHVLMDGTPPSATGSATAGPTAPINTGDTE